MKSTGIVRKIDDLGRIVLPVELRKHMSLGGDKAALEIYVDGESIILKKYEPACVFCGISQNILSFNNKNICPVCLDKLNQINKLNMGGGE